MPVKCNDYAPFVIPSSDIFILIKLTICNSVTWFHHFAKKVDLPFWLVCNKQLLN
jgi:hypothetical protein